MVYFIYLAWKKSSEYLFRQIVQIHCEDINLFIFRQHFILFPQEPEPGIEWQTLVVWAVRLPQQVNVATCEEFNFPIFKLLSMSSPYICIHLSDKWPAYTLYSLLDM